MSEALGELERRGWLLLHDKTLPSLSALVAGEPVRGSWWVHPAAHRIAREGSKLADHPDVLIAKLVHGKVTFVHRKLWPALAAAGSARERWQMQGLPVASMELLARLDRKGELELAGAAAKELELRLLAEGREVHTERGSHARHLESWAYWSARTGVQPVPLADAKQALETAVPPELLPWNFRSRR